MTNRRPRIHRKRGTQRRASARRSVTAARWGRKTGTLTPRHGNHRTSVRKGRGRVEMPPEGHAERAQECGERVRPTAAPAPGLQGFTGMNGEQPPAGTTAHFGATRPRQA